jgi:hypothetical protein
MTVYGGDRGGLKRRKGLERRTPLKAHSELGRGAGPKRKAGSLKRTPLGRCTEAQKERVCGLACICCGEHAGECHPAHVVPKGSVPQEVADDVRAVVPLCFEHHRAYDDGELDLSGVLEPRWRDSVEWATGAVGLWKALRYITGPKTLGEIAEQALASEAAA